MNFKVKMSSGHDRKVHANNFGKNAWLKQEIGYDVQTWSIPPSFKRISSGSCRDVAVSSFG